jgi:hypothetical protein
MVITLRVQGYVFVMFPLMQMLSQFGIRIRWVLLGQVKVFVSGIAYERETRVCVSRYKGYKVDDARQFIAALAFVDIPKPPIQDISLIVSLGQILTNFNALLLRPFLIEAFQRHDPAIVSILDRDVERITVAYRCEWNSPPLLRGVPPTSRTSSGATVFSSS